MPRTLPSDRARAAGQPTVPVRTAPYQGLRPFAEHDAAYFFGRETERKILVANLMAARLTLVYGESGVGKSSILRAGVVHHLREHEPDAGLAGESPRLLVVYVKRWAGDPVARLLARIGDEIARALGVSPAEIGTPSSGLAEAIAEWSARWNLGLLIILDQFEEYFLYHADEDEDHPEPFATEFTRAVNRADLPVSFLVAIREDALAKLDRFKGRIPKLFENYVRIRHLRASQAEATASSANATAQVSSRRAYTAQADTICAKGNARVEALGPRPSRVDHPQSFGRWLSNALPIGRQTSLLWHLLPVPRGQASLREVLDEYDRGLAAYESAARALVDGRIDAGRLRLFLADRLGERYVALAGRNGFRDCALALTPPPP